MQLSKEDHEKIIQQRVMHAKDDATMLGDDANLAYKSAVQISCPSQIVLLRVIETAGQLKAELANLEAILEGRSK